MSHASDPVGFDFAAIDTAHRYKLMSFTVVPRPIAWVSTVDAAVNLSTTVLVENGLIGTNTSALTNVRFGVDTATNILYYDANGNFASGSIAIAKSDLALTGLTNNNFIAIA